jgi:PPP family 3-phenylpropionic acid transporter
MGVLTLLCGPLYAAYGGGGFWAMAALCAMAVPAVLALARSLRASTWSAKAASPER